MSVEFLNEMNCVHPPVPMHGELWELELRKDFWTVCEVLESRTAPQGWKEYRVRYVTVSGRLKEQWWNGRMRESLSNRQIKIAQETPYRLITVREVFNILRNTPNIAEPFLQACAQLGRRDAHIEDLALDLMEMIKRES